MVGNRQLVVVKTPVRAQEAPRYDRQGLLLLGMSRSGTSLLGYLLHTLGAALPEGDSGPGYGNPLAHCEPPAFAAINADVLRALDRSWDDPRPINPGWFRSSQALDFIERIVVQIGRSYGAARLIVLIDPRLCRLAPLYLAALDILDIRPLVVLQLRPLSQVVRSLADRNGFDPALSEFLWLRSVIEAEWESRDCSRVWVTLDQVITDWHGTASRIAANLGIQWTEDTDEAAQMAARFLRPRRCQTALAADVRTGDTRTGSTPWLAARVWNAAQYGLAGDEPAARAAFDALRPAVHEWDRLYANCLTGLEKRHRTELAAIYGSGSWRMTAPFRALRRLAE